MNDAAHTADAARQLMRIIQPAQELDREEDHERQGQWSGLEQAIEIGAGHQLHDEEQAALAVAIEVEHGDKIGMLQL